MQTLALAAPLMILLPSIGALINFFWGGRLGERNSAIIGSVMSGLTFFVALILLNSLTSNYYQPTVVDPPFLDGWIRIPSIGLEIPWQMRVDTLSVTMALFVSFVGTFIHIYAAGYMHGDPRFARFFAYLNMFLAFMFILVFGNNFLMMFVGWEGVGLCSYLLIGFWWDKPHGEGWKNSNAARKAFIANRIGDFGMLMAMFLIFWTFGTLDFYKPTELPNPEAYEELAAGGGHGDELGDELHEEDDHSSLILVSNASQETVAQDHEEEIDTHGADVHAGPVLEHTDNSHLTYQQLGVFGKTHVITHLEEGETLDVGNGQIVSRTVQIGSVEFDIQTVLVIITLFLLLGAAGKSAQIPLFVWLPDAMAGPTPVSALIHAATMVTAGVYMMVRSHVFFMNAPLTSLIVTIIGASTAIVGGFIALGQFDIKRVLAYSTVSQLGFMVAAVGIGAYPVAIFHMITHAFFKALLFLGSGSVIHGMEHGHHHAHDHSHDHSHGDHSETVQHEDVHGYGDETLGDHHPEVSEGGPEHPFDPQDMRYMGGLRRRMPITYWTYIVGTLALAGIYPFAGFWSKDEILADSLKVGLYDGLPAGFLALLVLISSAALTAFYMWRQIEMVFHGDPRHEAAEYASESPWQMTVPLIVLAIGSFFVGFINIPSDIASPFVFFLDGPFGDHALGSFLSYSIYHFHFSPFYPLLALAVLAFAIIAIFVASRKYGNNRALNADGRDPLEADATIGPVWGVAHARMYWDEIYERAIIAPFNRISKFLADTLDWAFLHDYFHDTVIHKGFNAIARLLSQPLDLGLIDGAVLGVGRLVTATSGLLRRSQTGYVRVYAVALFLGVVAVIVIMLLPLIQG